MDDDEFAQKFNNATAEEQRGMFEESYRSQTHDLGTPRKVLCFYLDRLHESLAYLSSLCVVSNQGLYVGSLRRQVFFIRSEACANAIGAELPIYMAHVDDRNEFDGLWRSFLRLFNLMRFDFENAKYLEPSTIHILFFASRGLALAANCRDVMELPIEKEWVPIYQSLSPEVSFEWQSKLHIINSLRANLNREIAEIL